MSKKQQRTHGNCGRSFNRLEAMGALFSSVLF